MSEPPNKRIVVNEDEDGARVAWFVRPYDGLWARWEGRIELTWPNGSVESLWVRHSRRHERVLHRLKKALTTWTAPKFIASQGGESDG